MWIDLDTNLEKKGHDNGHWCVHQYVFWIWIWVCENLNVLGSNGYCYNDQNLASLLYNLGFMLLWNMVLMSSGLLVLSLLTVMQFLQISVITIYLKIS